MRGGVIGRSAQTVPAVPVAVPSPLIAEALGVISLLAQERNDQRRASAMIDRMPCRST
jgi:hypothetical protein